MRGCRRRGRRARPFSLTTRGQGEEEGEGGGRRRGGGEEVEEEEEGEGEGEGEGGGERAGGTLEALAIKLRERVGVSQQAACS